MAETFFFTYKLRGGPRREVRVILEVVGVCCGILEREKKKV